MPFLQFLVKKFCNIWSIKLRKIDYFKNKCKNLDLYFLSSPTMPNDLDY